MKNAGILTEKSIIICTYALCGFANFSSIAIRSGGIGGMAPRRQGDLSRLGVNALLAASLVTMMSGTIAAYNSVTLRAVWVFIFYALVEAICVRDTVAVGIDHQCL